MDRHAYSWMDKHMDECMMNGQMNRLMDVGTDERRDYSEDGGWMVLGGETGLRESGQFLTCFLRAPSSACRWVPSS